MSAGGTMTDETILGQAAGLASDFLRVVALRTLGRDGVRDLVERCCQLARRMAAALRQEPGFEVLNDVVLNRVLVRFAPPGSVDAVENEAFDDRRHRGRPA